VRSGESAVDESSTRRVIARSLRLVSVSLIHLRSFCGPHASRRVAARAIEAVVREKGAATLLSMRAARAIARAGQTDLNAL
jgi:hypothetical protein